MRQWLSERCPKGKISWEKFKLIEKRYRFKYLKRARVNAGVLPFQSQEIYKAENLV
jgi:hypothetical protein